MSQPLRLMVYDRSCRGRGLELTGLSHAWAAGGAFYWALGRIDAWHGAGSWAAAFDWIVERTRNAPAVEIQFWGHGDWGGLWIDEERLTAAALEPGHYLYHRLAQLRTRLAGPDALWWFRSCDLFGTQVGHDFARSWTRFFGCRAAGHTHSIMLLQSGLYVLAPGEEPSWPCDEGVEPGLPHGQASTVSAPRTITCLHNTLPRP